MKYRIMQHSNGGYIVQQSDEMTERWKQAYKTGIYTQKGSAYSRMGHLRREDEGRPTCLGARIMASARFCEI